VKLPDARVVALIFFASSASGHALCIYGGALYAKTTIEQEFHDSHLVIEGTVLSEKDIVSNAAGEEDGEPGSIYRIRADHVFKGTPASVVEYFTERDSGGFYLDAGTRYLLFLNPLSDDDRAKGAAPGALRVNYNCGQSQPWNGLKAEATEILARLSARSSRP
jgi:hypothetical protein